MTVNEEIITGRKFRKLIDEVNKIWQRISFWTKASDVEFDDGKDAETKVGAIDGITDSLASTSSRIAASAKSVNQLSNNLGGCSLEQDGKEFYIVGADTVRKKLGSPTWADVATTSINFSGNVHYAGDTVYSNSLPATYNGKTFLCLYFTVNFYSSDSFNNAGDYSNAHRPQVRADMGNRRVVMSNPVEHYANIAINGTATGVYV